MKQAEQPRGKKGHRPVHQAALTLAFVLFSLPAQAGAWLQEQGKTQILFSASTSGARQRFDHQTRVQAAGAFSKQDLRVQGEFGWTQDITLLAGLSGMHQSIKNPATTSAVGDASFAVGGRVKLWSGAGLVASVEGVAHGTGERTIGIRPSSPVLRRFEPPVAFEMRAQLGYGFTLVEREGFADIQIGYRWQGGARPDQIKLDMALGWKLLPSTLLMLQSFNTMALGNDPRLGLASSRQHKVQASIVQTLTPALSIQIGAFQAIAGKETLREKGVLVALWWKL